MTGETSGTDPGGDRTPKSPWDRAIIAVVVVIFVVAMVGAVWSFTHQGG